VVIAKKISYEEVSKVFSYDPETGNLIWIKNFHSPRIGTVAGTKDWRGYVYVSWGRKRYHAARIIWVLVHGSIDDSLVIDHINRNPSDNRISNLRLVTQAINVSNRSGRRSSGYRRDPKFYTKHRSGKFQVLVKGKYIGLVDSEDEAKLLVNKTLEQMP
jgi:hypothetical protein